MLKIYAPENFAWNQSCKAIYRWDSLLLDRWREHQKPLPWQLVTFHDTMFDSQKQHNISIYLSIYLYIYVCVCVRVFFFKHTKPKLRICSCKYPLSQCSHENGHLIWDLKYPSKKMSMFSMPLLFVLCVHQNNHIIANIPFTNLMKT